MKLFYIPISLKDSTCFPGRDTQIQIIATDTIATIRITAPIPITRTKLGRLTFFEVTTPGVDGRFGGASAGDAAESGAI